MPFNSWKQAPHEAYIVGLKELPENDSSPLEHVHIFFAHCYKHQAGWKDILSRFAVGKGTLLDLEFLTDEKGRRVAAFGYHAGFAGTAVGLETWCHQRLTPPGARIGPQPGIKPYPNEDELISYLKQRLSLAMERSGGAYPRIMVMGALGRCGTGACDFARRVGVPEENIIKWDMKETQRGGPFPEILDCDIFVNCIYLSSPIPPFMTTQMLTDTSADKRALTVIVDVSCDTTNPHNPIPIYNQNTTFDHPVLTLNQGGALAEKPVDVVAIDHLPTLLPREASESFCQALLPSLQELKDRQHARVWTDAEKLFRSKLAEAEL